MLRHTAMAAAIAASRMNAGYDVIVILDDASSGIYCAVGGRRIDGDEDGTTARSDPAEGRILRLV